MPNCGPEQGELENVARRLGILAGSPDGHGMREASAPPPGGVFPGEVQDAFIGTDALGFSHAVSAEEQAFVVPRAGLEKVHVLPVEFPAQRSDFGVERFDSVRRPVFEFGQDHFPRRQFVGEHARILPRITSNTNGNRTHVRNLGS